MIDKAGKTKDYLKSHWKQLAVAALVGYGAANGVPPSVSSEKAALLVNLISALLGL